MSIVRSLDMMVIVAPPRGERGLKSRVGWAAAYGNYRRSPSWGAWIEIILVKEGLLMRRRRSPSWGAWIEISSHE